MIAAEPPEKRRAVGIGEGREMRKILIAAIATTFAIGFGFAAQAQNFPTKPVTLIVPWPAGGGTDISMRALAEAAQKHLGQPVIIENKPGASGTVGPAQMAATAKPDGYTLAQIPITVFRLPFIQSVTFDPAKDFTYVIGLTGYTFGVVVKNDAPWKTFTELLDDAKANPGKIKYGTPGAGTTLHITMEQIAKEKGIKWTQVPFKGQAETNAAVLGGHVHAVADSTGWAALVNAGELRLLTTWGAGRSKNWPQVPTLKESGINIVSSSPFGLAGPKGMDPKVVKVLHDAFKKALDEPTYRDALLKLDQEVSYLSTEDYVKYAAKTIEQEKLIAQELGLKTN